MKLTHLLALASLVLFAHAALAEDHYTVEINGATSAGLRLTTGTNSTKDFFADAEVALPISEPMLDVAFDVGFESSDRLTATTRTDLTLLGGLQLNLGDSNPRNSFFLFGGAGFTLASEAGHTETEFTFRFRGGKRFPISGAVSYAPFVQFTKTNSLDGDIDFVPLSFSLFL